MSVKRRPGTISKLRHLLEAASSFLERYPWLGLVAALVVGAAFRLWQLTSRSPFLDEGFEYMLAREPLGAMLHDVAYQDYHPPLFYLLAHFAAASTNWPLEQYRLLTVPFGFVTIAATWVLGRRTFGLAAANIAAFVLAVQPTIVDFDRLWRMYSLLSAATVVSWLLIVLADNAPARRRTFLLICYGFIAIILPLLHYAGIFIIFSQAVYALIRIKDRWPVLLADGASLAVLLFAWGRALLYQYPLGGHAIAAAHAPYSFTSTAFDVFGNGLPIPDVAYNLSALVFTAFAIAVLTSGAWLGRTSILPFWLSAFVMQAAAAMIWHKDLLVSRYLLALIPAFALCLGLICASLLRRSFYASLSGIALAIGFIAVEVVASANLVFNPAYQSTDWNKINDLVVRFERPDDAMILDQGYSAVVLADDFAFRGHDIEQVTDPQTPEAAIEWTDTHPQRIWYVENQWKSQDPDRLVLHHLMATRRLIHGWLQPRRYYADRALVILFDSASRR